MQRNKTADLLKGLAVIFMVQVHLLELFARPDIYSSFIGKVSLFLGGPPAAPVFMAVMGYYFGMSKRTFMGGVMRGLKLILFGFALNVGLNMHLFIRIANGTLDVNPWPYLFGVDILFLAGVSLIVLAVLKHYFGLRWWFYLLTLFFIFVIGLLTGDVATGSITDYLIAYLAGEGIWWSYFPLIPWLAYPVLGFIFYLLMNRFADLYQQIRLPLLLISGMITFVFIGYGSGVAASLSEYYHHGFLFFIYTCGFLIFYAILIDSVAKTKETWLSRWVEWLGKNVTAAYVIQWLLIGNIATAIYKTQDFGQLTLWFIIILLITSLGIMLWLKVKKRFDLSIL